jgi:uncharacterized membrane protein
MTSATGHSYTQSTRATFAGVMALFALQWLWHGALFPVAGEAWYWLPIVFSLPPAMLALSLWLRRASARYWSGVIALLYFCHGITEAWTVDAARSLALAEVALAVAIILAANWVGLAVRFKRRDAAPPNV